jgi:peptidyl-dipeptidase A
MKKNTVRAIASSMALSLALAASPSLAQDQQAQPTAADAKAFMTKAEADLLDLAIKAGRTDWVYLNFITEDTEKMSADANARYTEKAVAVAVDAARYAKAPGLDYDTARKLSMARTGITTPAPVARMQGIYGKGQGTLGGKPINGNDIEARWAPSAIPPELKEMWTSWHDNVGKPMKDRLHQLVELMNEGARIWAMPMRRAVAVELRHDARTSSRR